MATATRELMVFKGHNLRTAINDEGEPGVLLADISAAIGIKRSSNVASRLSSKDAFIKCTLTSGGMQDMWYVTESGIYAVLVGSRKPLAKELTKVLLTELPKLRKQVVHSTDVLAPQSDHWAVLKAVAAGMIDMQADMEAVKSDIAELKASKKTDILLLKPVIDYSERVRLLIHDWVESHSDNPRVTYPNVHKRLNTRFFYKHKHNISEMGKKRNKSALQVAIDLGMGVEMLSLAQELVDNNFEGYFSESEVLF